MHPSIPYLVAALLFGVGVYGVLVRRNAVLLLMAVELMLNAVNLVLVTADATAAATAAATARTGQVFALFVIVLAAAEVGVGLAVILRLFRLRASVLTDGLGAADARGTADGTQEEEAGQLPAGGTHDPAADRTAGPR